MGEAGNAMAAGASSRHKGITDEKTGPKLRLKPSDASAAALMAEAREEATPTIAALTAIRDDPTATPSARVAAGRSLLEAAGMIGRERVAAKELLKKSLDEMTHAELEQAAELGRQAHRQLIGMMSIPELRDHIAYCQATLAERTKPDAVPDPMS
jgi:hypothetical protein